MSDIERCPDCGREAVFRYAAIGGIDRCENDAFHDRDYARNASTQGEALLDVDAEFNALVAERDALREELEETRNDVRMHAATNQRWRAENERLREALEVIGGLRDPYVPDEELAAFARTALEPTASNDTQEGT